MKKLYALTILTTLALGGVALAHPGKHGARKLERLDQNGDGKVTLQEMKQVSAQHFAELDSDKNGRIEQAELTAHHERMRAKFRKRMAERGGEMQGEDGKGRKHHAMKGHGKGRFFERFDQNGDGVLDAKEFEQKAEQRFARLDQNGDGVLTADELTRGHGRFHRRAHEQGAGPRGEAGAAAPAR